MSCPFFRPKMFSPGDCVWYQSRTFGAHVLPIVVGLHQMGCSFATCGTYTLVGSLKWIIRGQLSRLEAVVVVASPKSLTCVLFACISGGCHSLP